jgi:hypothetical protein
MIQRQPVIHPEHWNHLVTLAVVAQDSGTAFERALSTLIVNFFDDGDNGGADVTVPSEWVEQGTQP